MTGVPEAILNREVTLKMEAMYRGKQSRQLGAAFPGDTMKLLYKSYF